MNHKKIFIQVLFCYIFLANGMMLWANTIEYLEKNEENSAKKKVSCEEKLFEALTKVQDPEFEVNIVELGIVNSIECNEDKNVNTITILLTSPLCPYIKELIGSIKTEVKQIYPDTDAKVIVDMKTRWKPSLMSDEAKKRFMGIAK